MLFLQIRRAERWLQDEWTRGGASGSCSTLWRLAGVALRYPAHRKWLGQIGGPTTRRLLEVYPRIALRHSSPYLFAGASWALRLKMLGIHYAFINRMHTPAFFARMLELPGVPVWRSDIEGRALAIWLRGPCLQSRHRQGEASLAFSMDGELLATIAFSIIPEDAVRLPGTSASRPSMRLLYVGLVQGAAGRFDRVREATRLCHAIAPHDLLMRALAGTALAWGISGLVGVSTAQQLSAASLACSASRFDYDEFWRRHHPMLLAGGHALMKLPLAEKPIAEVSAKHRRRALVKRAFKNAVADEVCAAMRNDAAVPAH